MLLFKNIYRILGDMNETTAHSNLGPLKKLPRNVQRTLITSFFGWRIQGKSRNYATNSA
jgi:hypothetical protein